jgi:glycosidase
VTDFALADAVRGFLSGSQSFYKVYETISQDMVYSDPDNLLVFMDNHDLDRAMLVANENLEKYKLAINLILFTRGIPSLFYGSEIGIKGGKKHGELRQPFQGGFVGDTLNAFVFEGRTKSENEIFDYLTHKLKLRKEYPALSKGKLTHSYSGDNIYYLVKSYQDQKVLILMNVGEENVPFYPSLLKFILKDATVIKNLQKEEEIILDSDAKIELRGYSTEFYNVN